MGDNEKDREDEIPELKMEKDVQGESAPDVEPEVEVDSSDFTMVNDGADETGKDMAAPELNPEDDGQAEEEPVEVEIDASDITIIDDPVDDFPIGIDTSTLEPGYDPGYEEQHEGSPETAAVEPEQAPAAQPAAPDFDVLDYRTFDDSEAGESLDTPALDRKIQEKKEGKTAEKPRQKGFSTKMFKAGDVIFKQGATGEEAYLILSGKVKITRRFRDKSMKIGELEKDQIFGEMAIITGEPRTATAKAMEPTTVFIITEEKLQEQLSQNLAIVKSLVDQLIARVKQLLKQNTTMIKKVERGLLIDKKLEVIKAQIANYEKKKGADMDEKLKSLLDSILKI